MRANPNETLGPVGPWVCSDDVLTVTIGRGIGILPMDDVLWQEFRNTVREHLANLLRPTDVFGWFDGVGVWEGQPEESAVLTMIVGYTTRQAHVDSVLSALAERFSQDAIAYSFGPGNLAVPARQPATV
jgi:hypothetical protein